MNEMVTTGQTPTLADRLDVSVEQLKVIKNTIAKGATDEELSLFLYDCKRRGVHPLDKLIHFTKRGGRYVPITSIDFMRQQADKTGLYCGYEAAFAGTPKTADWACTVTVKKSVGGQVGTFTGTARWSEYYPGEGPEGGMWRKMPHNQLEKCAEALALRRAFPGLQGLYTREEMDQAAVEQQKMSLQERLNQRVKVIQTGAMEVS